MKYKWLHQNTSDELILFFNGWACDEHPFKHIQSSGNVLMFYDYKELYLNAEMIDIINTHKQVHVLAWSFGVWVAQCLLMPLKAKIQSAIAINGTVEPISIKYGIPKPIALGTLSGLSSANLERFMQRMVMDNAEWEKFRLVKPQRELDDVKNELFLLLEHFKVQKPNEGFFDCAIIGRQDRIMAATNQKAYWNGRASIVELDQPHFCFLDIKDWLEVIKLNSRK